MSNRKIISGYLIFFAFQKLCPKIYCRFCVIGSETAVKRESCMTIIDIKISDKIAICKKRYLISSNSNYIIRFDFDGEWKHCCRKTARLLFDGQIYDVHFWGNSVKLPKIPACRELCVGVFTRRLASTFAELGCIVSCADVDLTAD